MAAINAHLDGGQGLAGIGHALDQLGEDLDDVRRAGELRSQARDTDSSL